MPRRLLRRLAEWWAARRRAGPRSRAEQGAAAEDEAARLLRRKGYRLLARNYTVTRGEIDLVAFRNGMVAFVEVRSLREPTSIDPVQSITTAKQRRIVAAAESFLTTRRLRTSAAGVRFDVVSVVFTAEGTVARVRHLEGAFAGARRGFS